MKRYTHPFLLILFLLTLVGTTACTDEWDRLQGQNPLIVEEGLEGTLSLTIGSYDFENRVTALTRTDTPDAEDDEQHLHSIYIFVIDMQDEADCTQVYLGCNRFADERQRRKQDLECLKYQHEGLELSDSGDIRSR